MNLNKVFISEKHLKVVLSFAGSLLLTTNLSSLANAQTATAGGIDPLPTESAFDSEVFTPMGIVPGGPEAAVGMRSTFGEGGLIILKDGPGEAAATGFLPLPTEEELTKRNEAIAPSSGAIEFKVLTAIVNGSSPPVVESNYKIPSLPTSPLSVSGEGCAVYDAASDLKAEGLATLISGGKEEQAAALVEIRASKAPTTNCKNGEVELYVQAAVHGHSQSFCIDAHSAAASTSGDQAISTSGEGTVDGVSIAAAPLVQSAKILCSRTRKADIVKDVTMVNECAGGISKSLWLDIWQPESKDNLGRDKNKVTSTMFCIK